MACGVACFGCGARSNLGDVTGPDSFESTMPDVTEAGEPGPPDAPGAVDASCGRVAYEPAVVIPIGDGCSALAIGDLDGDGRKDLLVSDLTAGPVGHDAVSFLRNLGHRTFAPEVSTIAGNSGLEIRGMAVADLTGQGRLDVVLVEYTTSTLGVFFNAGGGVLRPQVPYQVGNSWDGGEVYVTSVAAGDLDGDGLADIVTADLDLAYVTGGGVSVFHNQRGVLGPEVYYPNTVVPGNMGGTYERGPVDVVLVDVDRDGALDIVTSNSDTHVAVYRNLGHGTFAPEVLYSIGTNGPSGGRGPIAVADLNDDSYPDIAFSSTFGPSLAILFNDGTGAFPSEVDLGDAGEARYSFLAAADLGHTGRNDLVGADPPLSTNAPLSVYLNQGGATFAVPAVYDAMKGDFMKAMAIDDLDGDGLKDIAIASTENTQIEVFYARCP
jgi:hypothetical protein